MKHQSGNALWFILIAIGLLGLLTITFSRSSKNNDSGDYEQNQIAATEILRYAKSLENAVQTLLAKGCSENEISFEHPTIGHSNPSAPSDNTCHVFRSAGAGMSFVDIDKFFKNGTWTVKYQNFVGRSDILNVGTNTANRGQELYLFYELPQNINQTEFCNALNRGAGNGITTIPVSGINGSPAYNGTFSSYTFLNETALSGIHTACIQYSIDSSRHGFYHVLHAR